MHGRLKVRTSAEEAARKKKEQEQKVTAYRAAMSRILEKKAADEHDAEMMELTSKLLSSNPDIATLWNLRRMCILKQKESDPEVQCVFDNDLRFTEQCLMVNPKSYCAWHQRCWILENAPTANWQKEVELCTKYLKLDERNFHCWDYRRYVVQKAEVSAEKEFDFCTEKIEKNFSNYSSWHYRSKLLPVLYPNVDDASRPISEEKLKEELELVLTAAFTDPNDSSAWFYQRWLLGYSQPDLDLAACRVDVSANLAVLSLTKPIDLSDGGFKLTVSSCEGDCNDASKWRPVNEGSAFGTTWLLRGAFKLNEETRSTVSLVTPDGVEHVLELNRPTPQIVVGVKKPTFGYVFGSAIVDVLKTQLASCQELLEYEPDSKWTLLTAALLMKAIDQRGYHETIRQHLTKLESVDSLRKGYYLDLSSKWAIENRLEQWIEAGDFTTEIDFSRLNLTVVNYTQYLVTADAVNLSHNQLVDRNVGTLRDLVFCRKLNLEANALQTGATVPKLPLVAEIRLKDNAKLAANDESMEYLRTKVSNIMF